MDIYRINSDLEHINKLGQTLSTQEKFSLSIALPALLETEKLSNLLFWGRIRGLKNDYYIALGMKMEDEYEFPAKKFYWSLDNFVFSELPPMVTVHADKLENLRAMFEGSPDKKVWEKSEEDEDQEQENENEGQNGEGEDDLGSLADTEDLEAERNRPPPPTSFSELDRLAYVVRAVESDCAVVPIGAFKLTPAHELRYDDNYKGLSPTEALQINNWQHFRQPLSVAKQELIQRDEAIFFKKFLDDLQDDQPKGCWSL